MKVNILYRNGVVALREVSRKTLEKKYFRTPGKMYLYRRARLIYDPMSNEFSWKGAKRKNRKYGHRSYVYVRTQPPKRKMVEVVVQGNAVRKSTNETGRHVYFEGYISGKHTEEEIVHAIFGSLQEEKIELYRVDEYTNRISVNFIEAPRGSEPLYNLDNFTKATVDAVRVSLHPARKFSGSRQRKRAREEHSAFMNEWEGE